MLDIIRKESISSTMLMLFFFLLSYSIIPCVFGDRNIISDHLPRSINTKELHETIESKGKSSFFSHSTENVNSTIYLENLHKTKVPLNSVVNSDNKNIKNRSHVLTTTTTTTTTTEKKIENVEKFSTGNGNSASYKVSYLLSRKNLLPTHFSKWKVTRNDSEISSSSSSQNNNDRQKRDVQRENVCSKLCNCSNDTRFLQVECIFDKQQQQIILDQNYYVPKKAQSLKIRLSLATELRIKQHFFNDNILNRIVIEGVVQPSTIKTLPMDNIANVQIETNAFQENNGVFPEIEILNVHTLVLRQNAFKGEFLLNITNCHEVIIVTGVFSNTRFHGFFSYIKHLRIFEKALMSTSNSTIEIVECKIPYLEKMDISMNEIKIINSKIGTIRNGTFDVNEIRSIIFQNTDIDIIESRAITDRLYSHHLEITNCRIGIIQSEAIAGSGFDEIFIEKNSINTIEANGISANAINISVSYNKIKTTGERWLEIKQWNNVTLYNNSFGNYNSIDLGQTKRPLQCLFQLNSITIPAPGSLNFGNINCKIREILFYQRCTCDLGWIKNLTTVDIKSESYCTTDDTLKHCFNATTFNVQKYFREVCNYDEKQIDCKKNNAEKKIDGNFIKPEDIDKKNKNNLLIYIGIGIIILILIISFIIIVIVVRRKCYKPKTLTIPLSEMTQNTMSSLKSTKLFSNEDRLIINQTLEKMKMKQPPEKYDQVYNNTRKLLNGNLTESEKVLTIGEIVRTLDECENPGEDFVAFTDILYKHLAPKDNNQNDPVYAEPNLSNEDNIGTGYNSDDGQTTLDHIYAEPHSVQQPLLTTEYSSPLDRSDSVGLYTEPIANVKDVPRKLISPYAISMNQLKISSDDDVQPSTSKNLPDVLNQISTPSTSTSAASKPLTNVQKIASNFANDPTFHITCSPNTKRKIPKYTIPIIKPKPSQSSQNNELHIVGTGTGADVDDAAVPERGKTDNFRVLFPLKKNDSTSSNSNSEHSGGSDITVKIDDVIEYADA